MITLKDVIVPLTKSPHPEGRFGREKHQDWYMTLLKAVQLSRDLKAGIILISDVHVEGSLPEIQYYVDALRDLGFYACNDLSVLRENSFLVIKKSQETIGQIDCVRELASRVELRIHFVSTVLHYPRVRFLSRGINAKHYFVCIGFPRPKEVITDIILNITFPLINFLGLRDSFRKMIEKRRKVGRH